MLPHSRLKPNQISLSNTEIIIFIFGFWLICCSLFTSRFSLNFSRNLSSALPSPDFQILGNCYNSLQFKIGIPTYFRISLYYASIVSCHNTCNTYYFYEAVILKRALGMYYFISRYCMLRNL